MHANGSKNSPILGKHRPRDVTTWMSTVVIRHPHCRLGSDYNAVAKLRQNPNLALNVNSQPHLPAGSAGIGSLFIDGSVNDTSLRLACGSAYEKAGFSD